MADLAQTHALVRAHLRALDVDFEEAGDGSLAVPAGTSSVTVAVEEIHGRTVVLLSANVLADVELTAQASAGLLTANASLRFGKFAWLPEERLITVDYELLGDTLDPDELGFTLAAVREIADHSDEKLHALLGGRLPHA